MVRDDGGLPSERAGVTAEYDGRLDWKGSGEKERLPDGHKPLRKH